MAISQKTINDVMRELAGRKRTMTPAAKEQRRLASISGWKKRKDAAKKKKSSERKAA